MDAAIAAFPILLEAPSELFRLATDLHGQRLEQHLASRKQLGIRRERFWIQESEGIGFLLLEGPGAGEAPSVFIKPRSEHDVWYRERLAAAFPADTDWQHAFSPEPVYIPPTQTEPLSQSTVLAFPIEPGYEISWQALGRDASGEQRANFEQFHVRTAMQQMWWTLREPEGEIALMYLEADDLLGSICAFADSMNIADLWLRQKFLEIQGVDWRAGIPSRMSQLVLDWSAEPAKRVIALESEETTLLRRGPAR